jgi:hypothetical protein
MDLGSERRGGEDEFQPPRGENRCREARVPTFPPTRVLPKFFFPILVHILPNSELEIFPAGPAMISGEAAWVHPEPIALSTTDGTRRGTHVNVQPSHQARGRASPRGLNPGRDAGRWRAATHTSPTQESAGQGEQCWQASLPAYTFLPQGSRTERTSSCDPFSKPQAGKPLSTPERSASRPGRPELELKPGRTTARWNSTHSQPRREPPEGGSCGAWWGAEDQTQESQIFFYLLGCVESFPSGEVKPAPQHFAGHTAEARPPSRPRRPPHAPRGWEEKRRARFDGEQAR